MIILISNFQNSFDPGILNDSMKWIKDEEESDNIFKVKRNKIIIIIRSSSSGNIVNYFRHSYLKILLNHLFFYNRSHHYNFIR